MARSVSLIAAIAASRSRSPSALFLLARSSAFSSRARAFIAARSSSVNPLEALAVAVIRLADLSVAVVADLFSGMTNSLLQSAQGRSWMQDQVARGIAEHAVADPIRLVDRLVDDLGVAGLQPREGAVDVGGG